MPSASKQQKRAKRAKTKARQLRIARQNPHTADPIVPDYFMPDFLAPHEDKRMDAEEQEAMKRHAEGEIVDLADQQR